jgi:hypothetical protein
MVVNLLANKKPTLSSGLALSNCFYFYTNATLCDLGKVPKSVTKRGGEGPGHRRKQYNATASIMASGFASETNIAESSGLVWWKS